MGKKPIKYDYGSITISGDTLLDLNSTFKIFLNQWIQNNDNYSSETPMKELLEYFEWVKIKSTNVTTLSSEMKG
jgi:hypothetical protein